MAGFGVSQQIVLTYAVLGFTSIAAFFLTLVLLKRRSRQTTRSQLIHSLILIVPIKPTQLQAVRRLAQISFTVFKVFLCQLATRLILIMR